MFHAPNSVLQLTIKAKTTIGVEVNRELIVMICFTEEDGILKMKQAEVFEDSKAYLELLKTIAEANASNQHA